MALDIAPFYHNDSGTISYVIADKSAGVAAIIDGVMGFDAPSGRVCSRFADTLIDYVKGQDLNVLWVLETHAHADHLSAGWYLRQRLGCQLGASRGLLQVQERFRQVFSLSEQEVPRADAIYDQLFQQGDKLSLGAYVITMMETPGHTNDSLTYLIDGNAFIGDTLFMPDSGTARCDFPGGSATTLYHSICRLHALPDDTRLWMCHDYAPNDREVAYYTTVAHSKAHNIMLNQGVSLDDFVHRRQARDAGLAPPRLLYPSLQVNIRGGRLPEDDGSDRHFLKIPLRGDAQLFNQER